MSQSLIQLYLAIISKNVCVDEQDLKVKMFPLVHLFNKQLCCCSHHQSPLLYSFHHHKLFWRVAYCGIWHIVQHFILPFLFSVAVVLKYLKGSVYCSYTLMMTTIGLSYLALFIYSVCLNHMDISNKLSSANINGLVASNQKKLLGLCYRVQTRFFMIFLAPIETHQF